jgi:hypothetical protein
MKRQAPHETQQPQLQPAQPAQAMQALQPPTAQPRQPPQALQALTTPPLHPAAAQPRQPPRQPLTWAYCWPGTSASLSKTKNVPKLTSKISSSSSVNCGVVSGKCTSGVGPTAPVAVAPPAIAMDTPTTPATGTAFFRCFCFVRVFVRSFVRSIETSHAFPTNSTKALAPQHIHHTPCTHTLQE